MTAIPVLVNLARPRGEVDAVQVARTARAAGLSGVGLADSPRLFPDPVVETTRVLASDPEVIAGPCVLSLPLVQPGRAASIFGTLADAFPGRLAAVVGRGESSLANEGIRPPGLREYAGMLAELRAGLSGGSSSMQLLGAASGPRTIEVTARELGGVLVDVGAEATGVVAAIARARAADPEAVVWAFVRMAIAHTPAEVSNAITPLLGSCAARMAAAPQWYGVGTAMRQSVADLAEAHDYRRHGSAEALGDAATSGDPDLARAAELVRQRFVLAGSPAVVGQRFRELAATGITGLVLAGGLPGVVDRLAELGEASRGVALRRPPHEETQP